MVDDIYYKALYEISSSVDKVVWSGKKEDYLKNSSTPRVCILIENIKNLSASIILLVRRSTREVEILLEYKGIPS